MNKILSSSARTLLVIILNLVLVLGIIVAVYVQNSDKSIILVWFWYPILLLLNGTLWGMAHMWAWSICQTLKFNTLLLLGLAPLVFLICAII